MCLSVFQDPEDGSYKAILPEADITQLYQRIVDTEIAVVSGDKDDSNQTNGHNSPQNLKLAAAMGLSQLMLPFRCVLNTICFDPARLRRPTHGWIL